MHECVRKMTQIYALSCGGGNKTKQGFVNAWVCAYDNKTKQWFVNARCMRKFAKIHAQKHSEGTAKRSKGLQTHGCMRKFTEAHARTSGGDNKTKQGFVNAWVCAYICGNTHNPEEGTTQRSKGL